MESCKRLVQRLLVGLVFMSMGMYMVLPGIMIKAENIDSSNNIVIKKFTIEKINNSTGIIEDVSASNPIKANDKIEINMEYSTNGNGVNENDNIVIKFPKELQGIMPIFPKNHFREVEMKGNMVIASGLNVDNAIGGYIRVNAEVANVETIVNEQIVVEINGKSYVQEIKIYPNDDIKAPTTTESLLYKTCDRTFNNPEIVDNKSFTEGYMYRPITDKAAKYIIYLNGEKKNLKNISINDISNVNDIILKDSIKIYSEENSQWIDVSNEFSTVDNSKEKSVEFNESGIKFNFGDISTTYKIVYSTKFDNEYSDLSEIVNTANLFENNNQIAESKTKINLYSEGRMITKFCNTGRYTTDANGNTVSEISGVGSMVPYTIYINEGNESVKNLIVTDIIPEGLELVESSVRIYSTDRENNSTWLSAHEVSKIISIKGNEVKFSFGDTSKSYAIGYELKVTEINSTYINKATLTHVKDTASSEAVLKYKVDAGAINASKKVDKKFLEENDKIVTYTIELESFGNFEKNYINVTDKIDDNVKILDVKVDENIFSKSIDELTNTVKITNSNGKIERNKTYLIKIKVDFSNVKIGDKISNVAYINDNPTNKVTTQNYFEINNATGGQVEPDGEVNSFDPEVIKPEHPNTLTEEGLSKAEVEPRPEVRTNESVLDTEIKEIIKGVLPQTGEINWYLYLGCLLVVVGGAVIYIYRK